MSTQNNQISNMGQSITHMGSAATLPPANKLPTGTTMNVNGVTSINVGGSWTSISSATYTSPVFTHSNGTVSLNSNGRSVSVDEIIDFMNIMKKRMLILEPNFQKHELYPALKEAYENYLLIERLCCGDDKPDEE